MNSKRGILKVIIDLLVVAIPALTALMLNLFVQPNQRGLFCDDESIMYPYNADTITTLTVALVGAFVSLVLIIIVETTLKIVDDSFYGNDSRTLRICNRNISPYIQNLYHHIGLLLFAMSVNQFITDGTKFAVGRLRPHFIDLCKPVLENGSTCNNPENFGKYIQNFRCSNTNAPAGKLIDARLSFPSGHSSFAFVCAIFCVFYLQSRMRYNGSKLLKHFIQLLFIAGALYTGLSRISDYKHHYSDVLAGALIGSIVAYIVCFHISKLFKRRKFIDTEAQV